jgi:hypothetical protein
MNKQIDLNFCSFESSYTAAVQMPMIYGCVNVGTLPPKVLGTGK